MRRRQGPRHRGGAGRRRQRRHALADHEPAAKTGKQADDEHASRKPMGAKGGGCLLEQHRIPTSLDAARDALSKRRRALGRAIVQRKIDRRRQVRRVGPRVEPKTVPGQWRNSLSGTAGRPSKTPVFNENRIVLSDTYFLEGGAGRANFAASTGTFTCTELSSVTDRPFVQVVVHLKAILIPETSR